MYGTQESASPVTVRSLRAQKQRGDKIVALTAYDASFARILDEQGVDVVLVGDSLGNVIQGHSTTLPVRLDDMIYHGAAVARGLRRAMLVIDMPFATYPEPRVAFDQSARAMAQTGAAMVKLEGAGHVLESIAYLSARDIPVCAHLGLTPQSVHKLGGYRVQGREPDAAEQLRVDARAIAQAGAEMLVLELVPADLAAEIARMLAIPVIGIGAGAQCDGQILVCYDMLGITPGKRPKFSRDFLAGQGSVAAAVRAYVDAVRAGTFPGANEVLA